MKDQIESFIRHIKVMLGLSSSTVEAYSSDLMQFDQFVKKQVDKIEPNDIYDFLATIENKRTLNRKLSAINHFFSWCYDEFLIEKNHKLKSSKVPKNLPKYLSPDQIESGLAIIDTSGWIGKRDYAFILFLYASGTRVSEALAVQKSDFENGWLRVRMAKGQKERVVPVANRALEALDSYLEIRPFFANEIFINYRGEKLSRISAYKILQKYLGVSPHTLRHSFATSLITGGADLRVVQELLGHSSLNTTQIYTHLEKKHLQDSVDRYHPLARRGL